MPRLEKGILLPIHPQWCVEILCERKLAEIRKMFPKDYVGWIFIYCTSIKRVNLNDYVLLHKKTGGEIDNWHSKVIAKFWCDGVEKYGTDLLGMINLGENDIFNKSCVSSKEMVKYAKGKNIYSIPITKLEVFDKPKSLASFRNLRGEPLKSAPQSFQYIYFNNEGSL